MYGSQRLMLDVAYCSPLFFEQGFLLTLELMDPGMLIDWWTPRLLLLPPTPELGIQMCVVTADFIVGVWVLNSGFRAFSLVHLILRPCFPT